MKNILLLQDCFVSTITLAALSKLGAESLLMYPETLRDLVLLVFLLGLMGQRLYDKLNCGYSMVGTNLYTQSIECFLACNAIMAGKPLDSDKVAYNSFYDLAWGVWLYCNLVGLMLGYKPTLLFSLDIKVYIRLSAKLQGISKLPPWLGFAQLGLLAGTAIFSDPQQLLAYTSRQQLLLNRVNAFITQRQLRLQLQLLQAKKLGFFA